MNRHRDWETRLVAYLAGVSETPFRAGAHDCALFTAGAVETMTGNAYATALAGRYTTIRGGIRALRKVGHADHVAYVAAHFEEVPPAFAHKGDIGVVPGFEGFGALGIVQGESVYVVTETGLGIVSRLELVRAFRV